MVESRGTRSHHCGERASARWITLAGLAVVLTCAVVGCSVLLDGGPDNGGDDASGPSSSTSATPEAPDEQAAPPSDEPEVSEVGATRSGANSDSTLLQARKVPAPDARSAPLGMEWYGIRARTCMHIDAGPSGAVPWSAWAVVTNAATRYSARRVAWDDFPAQQYPTTGLGPGRCHTGWVLVAVPRRTSRDVVVVTFTPGVAESLEWSV